MHSDLIESHKSKLKLTDRQREIIIGKLLGDGHLETQNKGKTYRLKIEHSIKQREHVDWLYCEFKKWVLTAPQTKIQLLNGKPYVKYWFNTLSHGDFRFYAQQFYQNRKKRVPKLIHHWLTPLVLAIWFMDDGSIKSKSHKARIINTQTFSKDDVSKLIMALKKCFDLNCKLRKQKEGYQIMILAESTNRFAQIIKRFILPTMMYKIKGLGNINA